MSDSPAMSSLRFLNDLPDEILLTMFSMLPWTSFVGTKSVASVCKKWNELANDHTLWKQFCLALDPNARALDTSWKAAFLTGLSQALVTPERTHATSRAIEIDENGTVALHHMDGPQLVTFRPFTGYLAGVQVTHFVVGLTTAGNNCVDVLLCPSSDVNSANWNVSPSYELWNPSVFPDQYPRLDIMYTEVALEYDGETNDFKIWKKNGSYSQLNLAKMLRQHPGSWHLVLALYLGTIVKLKCVSINHWKLYREKYLSPLDYVFTCMLGKLS